MSEYRLYWYIDGYIVDSQFRNNGDKIMGYTDIELSAGDLVQIKKTVPGLYAGCSGIVQRLENAHYKADRFAVIELPGGDRLAFGYHEVEHVA